jgi:hypothetical protein
MRAAERIEEALRRTSAQIDELRERLDAYGDEPPQDEPRPRKHRAGEINGRAERPREEDEAAEPRPARTTRRKPIGKKRLP